MGVRFAATRSVESPQDIHELWMSRVADTRPLILYNSMLFQSQYIDARKPNVMVSEWMNTSENGRMQNQHLAKGRCKYI